MSISRSKRYIATNPRFELIEPGSRPKLKPGEMTMIYECLERSGSGISLRDLVAKWLENGLADRFSNSATDPSLCVLYHLKLMEDGVVGREKFAQRQIVRELQD